MENGKANLGGAGLYTQPDHEKGVPLKKPAVGYVNGKTPASLKPGEQTRLSHSPLKVKGKK